MYDPAIARWNGVDALAEGRNWLSPYQYVQNSPMIRIDPDGNFDIYSFDQETGEINLIEKTDDNHDTLKDSDSGEVIVDNVDKGILEDGTNLKEDGLETSNVAGGVRLAVSVSMHISKEIAGVVYHNAKTDEALLEIMPYKGATETRNSDGKVTDMSAGEVFKLKLSFTSRDGKFKGKPASAFHTHPGHPDADPNATYLGSPEPSNDDYRIAMLNSMRGAEIDWVVYSKKDGTYRGVTSNTRIYRIDKIGGVKKDYNRRRRWKK